MTVALPEYLTLRKLSAYSGISPRSLRHYLTHPVGPLPHYRIQRNILVKRSDFDTWIIQFRRSDAGVDSLVDQVLAGLSA